MRYLYIDTYINIVINTQSDIFTLGSVISFMLIINEITSSLKTMLINKQI